jgi:hypothetical protein
VAFKELAKERLNTLQADLPANLKSTINNQQPTI